MVEENQDYIQTTIRIKRQVWIGLRRLQESGRIKSINHEANQHFENITNKIEEQK